MRTAILAAVLALALPAIAEAGWEPVGGVVNSDPYYTAGASVTSIAGRPYVGYHAFGKDVAFSGPKISVLNGTSWSELPDPGVYLDGAGGEVTTNGGDLYATWTERDSSEASLGVRVARWDGDSWTPVGGSTGLTETGDDAFAPQIAISGGQPCVAWWEDQEATANVYVRCFNGTSWVLQGGGKVNANATYGSFPSLAVVGGVLQVAWQQWTSNPNFVDLRVARLAGGSWQAMGGALNRAASTRAEQPDLVDISGIPYVAWSEAPSGTSDSRVHVNRYVNGAWEPAPTPAAISRSDYRAGSPAITGIGGVPFVTYTESIFDPSPRLGGPSRLGGVRESAVHVRRLDGATWVTVGGEAGFTGTADADEVYEPSIADVGGLPYVAFVQLVFGNPYDSLDLFVRRFLPTLVNSAPPKITGTPSPGSPLTCTQGVWSGSPTSFAYSWERAPQDDFTWTPIAGATTPVYTPTAGDRGFQVRCRVVATTTDETASAASEALTIPKPVPPPAIVLPPPGTGPNANAPFRPSFLARPIITASGVSAIKGGTQLKAGATPSPGAVLTAFLWDLNNDKKPDMECGAQAPALSTIFSSPGTKTVSVVAKDSRNLFSLLATATVRIKATDPVNPAGVVSSCVSQPDAGATSSGDGGCAKSFSWGIVDVQAAGGIAQCFQVEAITRVAPPGNSKLKANDPVKNSKILLGAKIQGPVKLNGIKIPLPSNVVTKYDAIKSTIGIGKYPLTLNWPGVDTITLTEIDLSLNVKPDKDGRFKIGGAKPKLPGIKALGGLKMGAGAEFTLVKKKTEVKLSLALPNIFTLGYGEAAEGEATILFDNVTGAHLDGARLEVPQVWIGPMSVSNLLFDYSDSEQTLTGGANIQFIPGFGPKILASPKDGYGFILKRGRFYEGGMGIEFDPSTPLFPGIGLRSVGANFGIDPLRLTGRLGIAVGEVADIDGTAFMALASKSTPYEYPSEYTPPGMGFLAGRKLDSFSAGIGGSMSLRLPVLGKMKISDAHLFYSHPGLVEAGGGISKKIDFDGGDVSLDGALDGFIDFDKNLFNFDGGVKGCLTVDLPWPASEAHPCLQVGGVFSTKGMGFCGIATLPLPFPPVPIPVGAGYFWNKKLPDIMIFSCDYGPYKQKNPRAGRAAQAARSFTLPAGLPATMVRLTGQGAPPRVVLTGPGGARYDTSAPAGTTITAFEESGRSATTIAIKSPAAGTWTVTTLPSSAPITKLETADGLPSPKIKASIARRGDKRVLSYDIADAGEQTVSFYERGRRTNTRLGVAKVAKGELTFAPADGATEQRKIVAVVERGVMTKQLTVARYAAPGTQPAAKPGRLRVRRGPSSVTVTWAKVPKAEAYSVAIRPRTGIRKKVMTSRTRTTLPLARGVAATVTVKALRLDARPSVASTATVRAR
jgi:hypothetical protein